MMSVRLTRIVGAAMATFGLICAASAQQGFNLPQRWAICMDPTAGVFGRSTGTPAQDYGSFTVNNDIFGVTFGYNGTSTFATSNGPCFINGPIVAPVVARLGLFMGPTGSVQSDFDDGMALNFGAPYDTSANFALDEITVDQNQPINYQGPFFQVLFTSGVTNSDFFLPFPPAPPQSGFTGRYIYAEYQVGIVQVHQQIDQYGDAVRVAWQLQNTDPSNAHSIGLQSGRWMAMLNSNNEASGFTGFGGITINIPDKTGFVVEGSNAPTLPQRFIRKNDPGNFPSSVSFDFGQANSFGMKVENGPLDEAAGFDTFMTTHAIGGGGALPGQQADTQADEFVLGKANLLLRGGTIDPWNASGTLLNGPLPDQLGRPYDQFNAQVGYIQKFYGKPVAAGSSRLIVQYYHTNWGVSDYHSPFVATVDAPKMLTYDPLNPNLLSPNPMTVRVSVDNVFTDSLSMSGQVTLKFRKSTGLSFAAGQGATEEVVSVNGQPVIVETCTKPIPSLAPSTLVPVDFQVQTDGTSSGKLPWTATVTMSPPAATKTLTGSIYASATPSLNLLAPATLISVPWTYPDTAWTTVLGLAATDFLAYNWDPVQQGYVISTSQDRRVGTWIVTSSDFTPLTLGAGAVTPDPNGSALAALPLKSGWNLIGNPYNYPIALGQLSGVPTSSSLTQLTFDQLVNQGVISGSVAFWDSGSQSYQYLAGDDALLEPNRGYWIFVFTAQDVYLSFPPVFLEWVPGTSRALTGWNQTENQWRLKLIARSAKSVDDQNYVGVVSSTKDVTALSAVKPPLAPTQDVGLSIEGSLNGKNLRLAQAYSLKASSLQWKVDVQSTTGGSLTLTWPNMASASTNTHFRLVDVAANVSRDMRQTSGYTFIADKNSTRQFLIEATPGGVTRAIIGDVVVSRPTRSPGAAFAITYSLSSPATTSIRILSGSGKEVYTVTSGRADSAGQNMASWALRDNANRAVAPGTYRIEIVAETSTGDRVRKIVPVNVVR